MALGAYLKGVREQKWNTVWIIVFHKVILQQAHHVSGTQAIQHQILNRLYMWKTGQHHI